jgi:hypothetical protein
MTLFTKSLLIILLSVVALSSHVTAQPLTIAKVSAKQLNNAFISCHKPIDYNVSLTASPSLVKVKRNVITGELKNTNITVQNFSSCPQVIKLTPSKHLSIANDTIILAPNEKRNIELLINVNGIEYESYKDYVYVQTITPNENQRIILKVNVTFNVR